MRVCNWNCISDDELNEVFRRVGNNCSDVRRRAAMHLIRWCLQGNPADRPTAEQVLQHPFLDLHDDAFRVNNLSFTETSEDVRDISQMVHHFYISHMRTEV